MFSRPGILMIGAAARNVGKTEFACRVIHRRAAVAPVVGAKVTAVDGQTNDCPRGGAGCGSCGSLAGEYEITEETSRRGEKDTERMLAAGATRVLWLRVRRERLAEGIAALLRQIPAGDAVVCESNSARTVLVPDLFLVIRGPEAVLQKPSCARVAEFADRIISFDGTGWDLAPDEVVFAQNRWRLRQAATAIVLAGGRSRRMGQDKSLLPIGGKPMIQHIADQLCPVFGELLIGANDPVKYAFLNAETVPDQQPDLGPLMGILSCLTRSRHDLNFVTGCDIPTLNLDFVLQLLRLADDCDVVMPVSPDGRPEPLLAVYRKTAIGAAQAVLARGGRRMVELGDYCRVKHVPLPDTGWYHNLNTPADYQRAAAEIGE